MITINTNEKQGQAIANPFGKVICFFLLILFGTYFSQDVNSVKTTNFKNKNQYLEIDSSNSSMHILGDAIVINHIKQVEPNAPIKSKKVKVYKDCNKRVFSKKSFDKKYYRPISYQNFFNKEGLCYQSSFVHDYIAYINFNNHTSKDKSILFTANFFLVFILVIILLKSSISQNFLENLSSGSFYFSRPPPLRSIL